MGCVYFIGCKNQIKIGYSTNIQKRKKQLQTANGDKLLLLGFINNCTKLNEKELHIKFRNLKLIGEFFKANEELIDYINLNNEIEDIWVELNENELITYKRMKI